MNTDGDGLGDAIPFKVGEIQASMFHLKIR